MRGALRVDHVLTKCFYLVRQYFIEKILSKMSHLNLYSLQENCALSFHSGYTSARVVRINWQLF